MAHRSATIDEEVWLTQEDVANGDDTVVKTAMEWIDKLSNIEPNNVITPTNICLEQNYPSTTITYSNPNKSNITLKVFDVLGSEVKTLVNKEQPQGNYEVEFDASTSSATGSELSSGIYFYRIQAGEFIETKKMILIK